LWVRQTIALPEDGSPERGLCRDQERFPIAEMTDFAESGDGSSFLFTLPGGVRESNHGHP
jgi:hypothetical protein